MLEQRQTTNLYIRKSTDIMQPILLLYGIAELLYQTLPKNLCESMVLRDWGHSYVIELNIEIYKLIEILQIVELPHLIPAILKPLPKSQRDQLESGAQLESIIQKYVPIQFTGEIIHYYPIKQQPDGKNDVWDDSRYPIWAHICSHFVRGKSMTKTYPLAVHIWHAHQKSHNGAQLLSLIVTTLANAGNNLGDVANRWVHEIKPTLNYDSQFENFDWGGSRKKLSMLSLISPGNVRGLGSPTISRSFVRRQPTDFWLIVYLSLAGFVHSSFPYKNHKDIFVNIPIFEDDCRYTDMRDLVSKCRKDYHLRKAYTLGEQIASSTINLYHLVNYYTFMESREIAISQFKMLSIEYKYVTSHIPGGFKIYPLTWKSLQNREHIDWIKLFFSQIQKILQIDEIDKPHFTELLVNFIQSGAIEDCLRFLNSWYSQPYKIYSQISFSLKQIRGLHKICKPEVNISMSTKYSKIFKNPGFLSIARAINHCTTYAAYVEGETKKQYPFKIRKELRRELLHVRHDPIAFIDKLGEFIIDYQDESGELRKKGHIRHKVSLEDVTNMMRLFDEFGIEVVSQLLLVAGYVTHYPSKTDGIEQTKETQL